MSDVSDILDPSPDVYRWATTATTDDFQRRRDLVRQIRTLHARGKSVRDIAAVCGSSRSTVNEVIASKEEVP